MENNSLPAAAVSRQPCEQRDEFPSLSAAHPEGPHGWIQWKGTNICMDIRCKCGTLTHVDADFLYHVKCGACGQVYECDGHVTLHPLNFEPEDTASSR